MGIFWSLFCDDRSAWVVSGSDYAQEQRDNMFETDVHNDLRNWEEEDLQEPFDCKYLVDGVSDARQQLVRTKIQEAEFDLVVHQRVARSDPSVAGVCWWHVTKARRAT